MPRKPPAKRKQDDPEQFKRFLKTAKEIGANPDPKAFDKVFKKVAESKPTRR